MYNTDIEKSKERIIGIDESKYICCCGCHIISCARFFSIVSIVLSAITLLFIFPYSYSYEDFQIEWKTFIVSKGIIVVYCVIDIILNAGVLYGIYKIKPAALLPYITVKLVHLH
uniref:Uncharacterized protein n=1 Tax=Acrobeloides nanus TaxID=290746 RepID=A0A914EG40_9BILA